MNRTQEEIVERIKAVEDRDFFGFERGDLLQYLELRHAKQFLQMDAPPKDWKQDTTPPSEHILRYLPFAWEKANKRRGISAGRSMCHMSAWLWLDGKDDLAEAVHQYDFYGKRYLVQISELYGVEWKPLDDGEWVNNEGDHPLSAEEVMGKALH